MKLTCAIIDDEPVARRLLQEYIEETDFLELVGVAEHPLKAIGMADILQADLLFLDINMPRMDGISFLRSFPNLPMAVMTTAYAQYAVEGFEHSVVDYLVKPFSFERFLRAARKALEWKTLQGKRVASDETAVDHFFVKCDGIIRKVLFSEVLFAEGTANYVTLHTQKEKLIVYLTMRGLAEQLPQARFLQVHKSYIVNVEHVQAMQGNVLFIGKLTVPIGNNYSNTVLEHIIKDRLLKR